MSSGGPWIASRHVADTTSHALTTLNYVRTAQQSAVVINIAHVSILTSESGVPLQSVYIVTAGRMSPLGSETVSGYHWEAKWTTAKVGPQNDFPDVDDAPMLQRRQIALVKLRDVRQGIETDCDLHLRAAYTFCQARRHNKLLESHLEGPQMQGDKIVGRFPAISGGKFGFLLIPDAEAELIKNVKQAISLLRHMRRYRAMITITIVRHGESTDNLRPVWAGWADAPLSNHGMNQAKALGLSLASEQIDAIFASPLKRAHWTAQQIQLQNKNDPPLTISPLLREQHFGLAEGHSFAGQEAVYVRQPGRTFKFSDGETLQDVRQRANEAIAHFIEPELRDAFGRDAASTQLVVVAHGIFNFEFLSALLSRRPQGIDHFWAYKGMTNTGWTQLEVGYEGEADGSALIDLENLPALPPLSVSILRTDVTSHLVDVERQGGGIGSAGFDDTQKDIRAFLSGAQTD